MDALRRIRPRAATLRRVPIGTYGEVRTHLRGKNRRLAEALDQLRSGVPLNWGQVEDDPELATLARLQQAGEECRLLPLREPTPQSKAALLEQLAGRIAAPRPARKPEKAPPKTLAGFSENVQVLTQVEDDVRLAVNWPASILKGALGLVATLLLVWGVASLLKATSAPTFSWIELRRGSDVISHRQHVIGVEELPCREARQQYPTRPGFFVPVQSLRDAQASVDYNIPLLPQRITVPITYTFQLLLASVDPCEGNILKPSDPGGLVSLQYQVNYVEIISNAQGKTKPAKVLASSLTLFAGNQQSTAIDVTTGTWKEIKGSNIHGVYWRGGPYHDQAGVQWVGDVSVLLVEHEDQVVTIIGSVSDGITEEMLQELARNISW